MRYSRQFNRCSFLFVLFASVFFALGGSEFSYAQNEILEPRKTAEYNYRGTKCFRFEHSPLPSWGYGDNSRKDYFYVSEPTDGPHEGRPLYVALHSAGGSGEEEFEWRKAHPDVHNIYAVPDGFYGMFPDCGKGGSPDWWYGGRKATESEITPELAKRSSVVLEPVEKRILAEVAWVIEKYKIDPNRVYLCGNSMGGSGTLGLGLRHGDVFAAIKANVPAGIWHAYDRLQLAENHPANEFPDPPVCLDYSAQNDSWSYGHEALFEGMERRKYSYIAYWGNFGHENLDENVAKVNDLFNTFDWTNVRKNEAYPVFTNVSTDDRIPWPSGSDGASVGQRGAYFRWTNKTDSKVLFEMELRLASADELKSIIFEIPTTSQADVTLRRMQLFHIDPNEQILWSFGDSSGEAVADETGIVTIPGLTVSTESRVLTLKKR